MKTNGISKLFITTSLICGAVGTLVFSSTNMLITTFALDDTTWTLNGNNTPTSETRIDYVEKTYDSHTTYGFTNVGHSNDGLCILYEGGKIEKVNDDGVTYGLSSIKATFEGSLRVVSMYEKDDNTYFTYTLTSGETTPIEGNYYYLEAIEDTELTSFTVNYGCEASEESIAPTQSSNFKLSFSRDDYATVELINGNPYFVLRGTYNETPMNSAFWIAHDDNTYRIQAEKTEVYTQSEEVFTYFNLASTTMFEDGLATYYPHISYNGTYANNLVYRKVDSVQKAPTPLTKIAYDGYIVETKFPNLAGGMVSIDITTDEYLTPYKYYRLSTEIEGKTASTRLVERERIDSWVTNSGYGKGVEYYNGFYYGVRENQNSFFMDKLSFNGGWKVEASTTTAIDIDGANRDIGRIFAYDGKIFTFDYYDEENSLEQMKLVAWDAETLEPVDVTLEFGGRDENEQFILAADYSEEHKVFAVLACSNQTKFTASGTDTAHVYIYDETDLTTPKCNVNVASGQELRDVTFYKNVVEVLGSGSGGAVTLQDFSFNGSKLTWQQNYSLTAKIGGAANNSYNAQALTYNNEGQIVFSFATWGSAIPGSDTHVIGIYDAVDFVENDSLYNNYLLKQYGESSIEKSFVKGAIPHTSYVCQVGAGVTDNNEVYFLLCNGGNSKGIVQKVDVTTGEYIGNPSAQLDLYSTNYFNAPSNGISYFDGHLYVYALNGNIYRFANDGNGNVDLTSYETVTNPFTGIDASLRILNVTQGRDGKYVVACGKNESKTTTIYIYDSNKELELTWATSTSARLKNVFATKDYIYVSSSDDSGTEAWPKSTVAIYSYKGSKLATHVFSNLGDNDGSDFLISMNANCPCYFEVDGSAYVTVNTWQYTGNTQVYDLYRFQFKSN